MRLLVLATYTILGMGEEVCQCLANENLPEGK